MSRREPMPLTGANSGRVNTDAVDKDKTITRDMRGSTTILEAGRTFFA